jgi:hypothetical protein
MSEKRSDIISSFQASATIQSLLLDGEPRHPLLAERLAGVEYEFTVDATPAGTTTTARNDYALTDVIEFMKNKLVSLAPSLPRTNNGVYLCIHGQEQTDPLIRDLVSARVLDLHSVVNLTFG